MELVQQLIQIISDIAPGLWRAMVWHVQVEGATQIAFAVFLIILSNHFMRRGKANFTNASKFAESTSLAPADLELTGVLLQALAFVMLIAGMAFLMLGIEGILSPEYWVIRDLVMGFK